MLRRQDPSPSSGLLLLKQLSLRNDYLQCNQTRLNVKLVIWVQLKCKLSSCSKSCFGTSKSKDGFEPVLETHCIINRYAQQKKAQIVCDFYIQGSVHREIHANNCPRRCKYIQIIYICKPLYMFRVVSPPIIRSSCHCIHSIWH